MSQQVLIDGPISWRDIARVAEGAAISLSESRWTGIRESRAAVMSMVDSGQRAYGVNTGLGDLCNHLLDADQLGQMSRGTILNHACGVGPLLEKRQVRAIMAAALVNFSQGYSGLSLAVVEALMAMLNRDLTPQVPSLGSVGYLRHMAHIALPLLGVGEVDF
ncbi:MAG: aromatic amino acid lyase, partial [Pseudomonadales bacterium]|nr:aromatic amino acid lyase [Pseudomonadales bacterium]